MISMDKKYVCRDGTPVTILSTSLKLPSGMRVAFVAHFSKGDTLLTCYPDGRYYSPTQESPSDLIEVSPYADFSIDDKVMVSDDGVAWCRRYFAGVTAAGEPMVFLNGSTSWTQWEKVTSSWNFCRRPTPEELGGC